MVVAALETTTLAVASIVSTFVFSFAVVVVVIEDIKVSKWTTNSTLVVLTGDLSPTDAAAEDRGDA